jgi:hypothetical protein
MRRQNARKSLLRKDLICFGPRATLLIEVRETVEEQTRSGGDA